MDIKEFEEIFNEYLKELDLKLEKNQIEQFYNYMQILIEWNEKMNLTAITEEKEIIIKHFIDSLTIYKYLSNEKSLIDVGTGAGFPGIPIKILKPEMEIVLLDSLNKRVKFLEEVINKLELKNIVAVHGRAEDFGKNINYREKFDVVTSRAVANLPTLLEYLAPFVKVNKKCICMKGQDVEEELKKAKKAIDLFGLKVQEMDTFLLPRTDMRRNLVVLDKVKSLDKRFPRKAGMPAKEPIV